MSDVILDERGEELPEQRCPSCGAELNAASSCEPTKDRPRPAPWDVSVCYACGTILQFRDLMLLREVGEEELGGWPDDIRAAVLEIQKFTRQKNPS